MKTLISLVGTKYRGEEMVALLASLEIGAPIEMRRDRDNKHDPYAIEVWAFDAGKHIGYLARGLNRKIALMMDRDVAGGPTMAKLAIDGGGWPQVEIDES